MPTERRDSLGTLLGLLTFFGGLALIAITFALARSMFGTSPDQALGVQTGEALNVNRTVDNLSVVLVKIALLVVMGGLGSMVATRGIKLYGASLYVEIPRATPANGKMSKPEDAEREEAPEV